MSRKKNATMQEYGSRVSIESETVIHYIIDAIQDDTADKIWLYGAKNFNDFKEIMKLYDQIKVKKIVYIYMEQSNQCTWFFTWLITKEIMRKKDLTINAVKKTIIRKEK